MRLGGRAAVQPCRRGDVRAVDEIGGVPEVDREMLSGQSGGRTTSSTRSAYSATSVISRRWTSRLTAWTATASGRAGDVASAQAYPVGST